MAPAVVFFGSDAIVIPALQALESAARAGRIRLAGLVSQPDRPVGRGQKLAANPAVAWARARGLQVLQPQKPDEALLDWMRAEDVALGVVMAYGHLLREALLGLPALGCVNLHGSLLPAYRGASPVETALACGESVTGVALMRIVRAMDAGPVCAVEPVPIEAGDTGPLLRERVGAAAGVLLGRELESLLEGRAVFVPQDEARATYTRKLTKEDGALDFSQSAATLARRIRAMDAWPGSFCAYAGVRLRVAAPRVLEGSGCPGEVVGAGNAGLDVATGEGVLRLEALQRPGGRLLAAGEFLRGFPVRVGEALLGGAMPPLLVPSPSRRQGGG